MLLCYDFKIEYRQTTKFGQADALSRLIYDQQNKKESEDVVIGGIEMDIAAILEESVQSLPITHAQIRACTEKDDTLVQVEKFIREAWPKKIERESALWHFYNHKDSLSIVQDCIMMQNRIVIPKSLQNKVLKRLHVGHPGVSRMKRLARSFVYWPRIDNEIERLVKDCEACSEFNKDALKAPLHLWEPTTRPWERVHADFAGPVDGLMYLIIVDAYSKWPEIFEMKSATASTTIERFMSVCAKYGNPQVLVTDNGVQFNSEKFEDFCRIRGIEHINSPPFHPQSNGQAERFVDTFKRTFKKLRREEPAGVALQTMLQAYRSTPKPDGKSPAELFLGRQIRTELSLLVPDTPPQQSRKPGASYKMYFDKRHRAKMRVFRPEEPVFAKDYRTPNRPKWVPGVVIERKGKVLYR
ncbi:PREDICTED: uncharacterized protein K02A2.6-like, partial [Rhagoletis zephyria]|uniref:uncharacterized protein K02A2.6-like n=1 Tax=Rhagoletis zephyria TaxID=28612 RepID=UPI000811375C